MEEMLKLVKQCLSIVETATLKDEELKMLIQAGVSDLQRQGIKANLDEKDNIVKSAIVMFVKGNFGNVDIKEKELAQRTYSLLCNNISLSSEYKVVDNNA